MNIKTQAAPAALTIAANRAARTLIPLCLTPLLLAACASEPRNVAGPGTPGGAPMVATPSGSPAEATRAEPTGPRYRGPWEDPNNPLYHRTIFFDYDSTEVKPQYLDLIRTHAAYLGGNKGQRVTLEGHSDERGTREYNLALGDRRAETVRQLMLAEGVGQDQAATLSYGEEKPADYARNDAAWQRNRRVIIQY